MYCRVRVSSILGVLHRAELLSLLMLQISVKLSLSIHVVRQLSKYKEAAAESCSGIKFGENLQPNTLPVVEVKFL